jgi:hypothetical protein
VARESIDLKHADRAGHGEPDCTRALQLPDSVGESALNLGVADRPETLHGAANP